MSFKTGFTEQLGRIAAATVVEIAAKVFKKLIEKPNRMSDEENHDKVFETGEHYYAYVNSRVPHIDNLDLFEELFDEVTETKNARYILDLKYSEMIKILDEKCPEWETILDEKITDRESLESEGNLNNPISRETLVSISGIFEEYDEKDDEKDDENTDNDEKEN